MKGARGQGLGAVVCALALNLGCATTASQAPPASDCGFAGEVPCSAPPPVAPAAAAAAPPAVPPAGGGAAPAQQTPSASRPDVAAAGDGGPRVVRGADDDGRDRA